MANFDRLDAFLAEHDLDGYLLDDSAENADQRYLSGYDAGDPYVTLYEPDGIRILIKELEYPRAKDESRADEVRRPSDYGYSSYAGPEAHRDAVAEFLAEFDVDSVGVPTRFPAGHADGLRERGLTVAPEDEGLVAGVRAIKTEEELAAIEAAHEANEAAMAVVEEHLAAATIEEGTLRLDGEVLTAERVRRAIRLELLDREYTLETGIVAGGSQGAEAHERGSGPLPADEPIVVDLVPRDEESGYHADMTRTFVRGEPSDEVRERYELTREALDAALSVVEPGATGAEVHAAVCDVYEDAGYPTLRSDPETETGYIHATGHGVGLEVHEGPGLNEYADQPLRPGHVITVEPGLYDPALGGVRIEDLVVVTEDGHDNLTEYPIELVI